MRYLAKTIDLVAAFDSSPNPYALLDRELRFVGMNQAYLDVARRQRSDLIGLDIMSVFAPGDGEVSLKARQRLRISFDKVMSSGQPDHLAVLKHPITQVNADGELSTDERYWSCTHTPIKDDDGVVSHILQDATDVTDLVHGVVEEEDTTPLSGGALEVVTKHGVFQRAMKIAANNQRLEAERKQLTDMLMNAPGFVAVLNGPDHIIQF